MKFRTLWTYFIEFAGLPGLVWIFLNFLYFPQSFPLYVSATIVSGIFIIGVASTLGSILKRTSTGREIYLYFLTALQFLCGLILLFAFIYKETGLIDNTGKAPAITHAPPDVLYFSAITWTTVGYGDIVPTRQARSFAAIEALFGYVFMACLIGGLFHLYGVYRLRQK